MSEEIKLRGRMVTYVDKTTGMTKKGIILAEDESMTLDKNGKAIVTKTDHEFKPVEDAEKMMKKKTELRFHGFLN